MLAKMQENTSTSNALQHCKLRQKEHILRHDSLLRDTMVGGSPKPAS